MSQAPTLDFSAPADIAANHHSFVVHMRAENKSPSTIVTYGKAIAQLDDFLATTGMPRSAARLRREHVEAFLADLHGRGHKPATVAQRYRSLQQFFKWLRDEGEIRESPMTNMRPPHVPETPPPVLRQADMRKLLAACEGPGFDERRDAAIVRLFLDTGMRRSELAGLRLVDVAEDKGGTWVISEGDTALVLGKGRRPRGCPFGRKTGQALDRYLRARARHPHSYSEWLWLGRRGRLTETGVEQAIKRRGQMAGLVDASGRPWLHPHLFRHTFAHEMLSEGMQEGDLMQLAGWKSRHMLARYGASAANERARAAYRRYSPIDRL